MTQKQDAGRAWCAHGVAPRLAHSFVLVLSLELFERQRPQTGGSLMTRWLLRLLSLALCFGCAIEVSRAGTVYYGTAGGLNGTSIGKSAPDGSGFTSVITSNDFAGDIEIDSIGGKIYWGDSRNPAGTHSLYRANLDGTQVETLATVGTGIDGVGLDLAAGKVYFGSVSSGLFRANLDGTGQTQILSGSGGQFNDVEILGGQVYWSSLTTIKRANLDGTGVQTLVSSQSSIVGLDVVGGLGKMFWADQSSGLVQSANLDGSSVFQIDSGEFGARGVVADEVAGHVYWGLGSSLRRANLDGTNQQQFASGSPSILSLQFEQSVAAVPEPASAILVGIGVLGMMGYSRRRRSNRIQQAPGNCQDRGS
jgi:hypothetical protein